MTEIRGGDAERLRQPSRLHGALRIATVVTAMGLGAIGIAAPDSVLWGGLAWLSFLLCACSGWGFIVVRLARTEDPDLGMRAALGIAGYLAITGWLVAFGVCSRPVILVLIGSGIAGFAWREMTVTIPTWTHVRDAGCIVRRQPAVSALIALVGVLALVQVVGAVITLDRNPWDDDLAYTPLIQRVLGTGDLVEPFSFRRMGAYGGQTLLQALLGARGTLSNVHALDQGLCFGLTLLLVIGYARERRTSALWLGLLASLLVLMPDTAINTASYWSGAALLVAVYRSVAREQWVLVALLAAAACTLRQSYIAVVVLFVGLVLLMQLRGGGRRSVLLRAGVIGLIAIAGWWIAALISNRTFLFPLMEGTFNSALSLKPTAISWPEELQFLLWCSIESTPIVVFPPLFAVLALIKDPRPGRPLTCLFLATVAGFALLVHSFTGSEASHLWRYAFGPAVALLAIMVIELGSRDDRLPFHVPRLAQWIVLVSLGIQIVSGRHAVPTQYAALITNIRHAAGERGDPNALAELQRYAALQASIPAGGRIAVMLDDPAFLDFGRNPIVNLDTPGYASPGEQLPSFEGAEAWRTYLRAHGIRYVAFVRSRASRAFFRREFWVWRIFHDSELFQAMSAYTIDAIDTMAELARTSTILHDADGLVALDLGVSTATDAPRTDNDAAELARRDAFVRTLASREGLDGAWSLNSRANVLIEDGFTGVTSTHDKPTEDPGWFDASHAWRRDQNGSAPARWMFRRAHVRLRAAETMRLQLRGTVNLAAVSSRPRLDVSLDGALIASVATGATGEFSVDVAVPANRAETWRDLYLVFTSVDDPGKEARDIRVARLLALEWEPVGVRP